MILKGLRERVSAGREVPIEAGGTTRWARIGGAAHVEAVPQTEADYNRLVLFVKWYRM